MRTVKASSAGLGVYTYRLNRASMTEMNTTYRPYRLQKKELKRAFNLLKKHSTVLIRYYIGNIHESNQIHSNIHFTATGPLETLEIGCMIFSPAETKKLIKWAKE